MVVIEVEEAPKEAEAIDKIEGIKIGDGGKVFVSLPHLRSYMTPPDRAKVLDWHLKEGDIVTSGHDEIDMVTLDFLGDDWYLPIPPLNGPMRVAKIEASVGKIIHLHDLLIIFEPVQDAA